MSRNFGLKAHEIEDEVWIQEHHDVDITPWLLATLGLVALGVIAASMLL